MRLVTDIDILDRPERIFYHFWRFAWEEIIQRF